MIEHWVEQYHQKGAEMERMWAGHSYAQQAKFCARREEMLSKKETMIAGERITDSKRKVKRKQADTTLEERGKIKEGRRLIKEEVQQQMNNDAVEGSMDIDGNDDAVGSP